jgi:hypothetical protein
MDEAVSSASCCAALLDWNNVTEHPTAAWTGQQIVEAFPDDTTPAYLSAIATRSTASPSGNA